MPETSKSETIFTCPICLWVASNRFQIPMHFRWSHPGMRHCPKCNAVLLKPDIKEHIASHKNDLITCKECGRMLHKKSVGGHMAAAHSGVFVGTHARAMEARSSNLEYRKYLSERMTKNNPMEIKEARLKAKQSIRRLMEQGAMVPYGNTRVYGNGNGPTPAESLLLRKYTMAKFNFAVTVGDGERPYHYKIDVAFPEVKAGIELDGTSHLTRTTADQRKDRRLLKREWKILRVPNEDAESEKIELFLSELGITPG